MYGFIGCLRLRGWVTLDHCRDACLRGGGALRAAQCHRADVENFGGVRLAWCRETSRASAVVIYLLHIHTYMIHLVLVFVLARMISSTMFLFHIEIEIENLNKHALMHIDTCSAPSPWREAPNCAVHHVVATVVLIWGKFSRFSLLLIKSSILRIM